MARITGRSAKKSGEDAAVSTAAEIKAVQEEIDFLRQKVNSLVMRGHYAECFKLIEDNIRLLYFKNRWPDRFFACLRIHRKCFPSLDISQTYDDYLTGFLKRTGVPTVFVKMLKGSDTSIDWSGEYFRDLALVAHGKGDLEDALGYCDILIKLDPRNSNALLLKGHILTDTARGDEAVRLYEESLAINETNYQAWHALALHFRKSDPHRALECIERAIDLYASDARFFAAKASILLQLGNPDEALACYDEAVKIDPLNAEFYYERGEILLAQGHTLSATRQYSQAVGIREQHVPALTRLAGLHQKEQPELALPYINTVCTLEPENIDAALLRGKLLMRLGDRGGARKQFRHVLTLDEACADAHAGLGELLLEESPQKALESFQHALDMDNNNAACHLGKAKALEALGQIPESVKEYAAASTLDGRCEDAWAALGRLHAQTAPETAAGYYDRAIALNPANASYHRAKGEILLSLPHRLEDSRAAFDAALQHDPGNVDLHLKLAELLERAGNTASALEHYRAASGLDVHCHEAFYGLARLLIDTEPDTALLHINSAITLDATNSDYYFFKAKVLSALGASSGAIENLRKTVYKDPSNAEAMDELGRILSGESPRVALLHINRAIELAPDNSGYLCLRADLLVQLGSPGKALPQYEQAIKADASNHAAFCGLGRILADRGDKKALECFDKAIALSPGTAAYHAAKASFLAKEESTCQQALDCFDRAIQLDNQRWEVILEKAFLQDKMGDLPAAEAGYRRVLLVNRNCLEATARIGQVLSEHGSATGLSYLDHAIELDPADSRFHIWKARLLYLLGREAEAEDAWRAAIALGGGSADLYYSLAEMLLRRLPETALRYNSSAIELAPDNPAYHLQRGNIFFLLGERREAKKSYNKALECDPNCHEALARLARIHCAENDPAAAEMIDRALALAPDSASYHYIKSQILDALEGYTGEQALDAALLAVRGAPDSLKYREQYVGLLHKSKARMRYFLERRKLDRMRRREQRIEDEVTSVPELPQPEPEEEPDPAAEEPPSEAAAGEAAAADADPAEQPVPAPESSAVQQEDPTAENPDGADPAPVPAADPPTAEQ